MGPARKLFVLLLIFSLASTVFAMQACNAGGRVKAPGGHCNNVPQSKCNSADYFGTDVGNGTPAGSNNCGIGVCQWATIINACDATWTPPYSCKTGVRNVKANCFGLQKATCSNNCAQFGTHCNLCALNEMWSTPGNYCRTIGTNHCLVPEFVGIEFPQMQLSTGILAILAAIGLPLFLFKRNKKNN